MRIRMFALSALLLAGCATTNTHDSARQAPAIEPATASRSAMDEIAIDYVKLVLALGIHDDGYVDAFYGPAGWKAEVEAARPPLEAIATDAEALLGRLGNVAPAGDDMQRLRQRYLQRQLQALRARIAMLQGTRMSFDEESRALYDAVAPTHPESHFAAILERLDAALPGSGTVAQRYQAWRAGFVIPPQRLDAVFRAAVAECRRRTLQHVALPDAEDFRLEYVTDKPWSGYNWYQGGFASLIQVNTELPIFIDRAIDLACHEGYPGHHAYNVLLEKHLVRDRGWPEFSVYALYSPQSLIAEGTANYGIEVAFPGGQRPAYERDVLFPLAGLDPAEAAGYYRIQALVEDLGYAGNEAARRYLDGTFTRTQAEDWLVRYALMEPERAQQRVRFIDTYRSYVINYNLGKDIVRDWVERHGGTPDAPARRWQLFEVLLSSPRLPSDLREAAPAGRNGAE